jgi:D-alanyl-lipoteichoic acid acyltransferase DltB (MBOAT superfamily)
LLFTSGEFLFVFLPITLLVFFAAGRWLGKGVAAAWLALASLAFYGYWRIEHTALLVLSIAFNYGFGEWILRVRHGGRQSARILLGTAIAANLAALAYFKYADFFLRTAASVSGADIPLLGVVLPLGISFFTFTQIAVPGGRTCRQGDRAQPGPLRLVRHLLSASDRRPVLHHAEMMPQFRLAEIYRPQLRKFVTGLSFLLMGLAKKGADRRQRRSACQRGFSTRVRNIRCPSPQPGSEWLPTPCRSISISPVTRTWPSD